MAHEEGLHQGLARIGGRRNYSEPFDPLGARTINTGALVVGVQLEGFITHLRIRHLMQGVTAVGAPLKVCLLAIGAFIRFTLHYRYEKNVFGPLYPGPQASITASPRSSIWPFSPAVRAARFSPRWPTPPRRTAANSARTRSRRGSGQ